MRFIQQETPSRPSLLESITKHFATMVEDEKSWEVDMKVSEFKILC